MNLPWDDMKKIHQWLDRLPWNTHEIADAWKRDEIIFMVIHYNFIGPSEKSILNIWIQMCSCISLLAMVSYTACLFHVWTFRALSNIFWAWLIYGCLSKVFILPYLALFSCQTIAACTYHSQILSSHIPPLLKQTRYITVSQVSKAPSPFIKCHTKHCSFIFYKH